MVAPLMEDSTVCYDGSHFGVRHTLKYSMLLPVLTWRLCGSSLNGGQYSVL